MKKCPQCNFENIEGEILCVNCGQPLNPPDKARGSTRILENVKDVGNFPRWGTARLGDERKLLLHVRGHDEPLVLPVGDRMVLGRKDTDTGDAPDIDLTQFGAQEQGVSRRHAAILIEDDALKVMDLGSANSTYMNGQRLIPHQARILRDGDELRLARLVIRVNFA